MRRRWTADAVIRALADFHRRHGRAPTTAELGLRGGGRKHPDLPVYAVVRARCGSLRTALELAGVPYRPQSVRLRIGGWAA